MAKTANLSMADRLATHPLGSRGGQKTWFEKITNDERAELVEIRKRYQSGDYPHTKSDIYVFCAAELKLTIRRQAFIRWLDEKPNG